MSVWKRTATLDQINEFNQNTLVSHLGIEVTEIGEDYLSAIMPVADYNKQPMGYLHGGASVVLAETLGSIAAYLAAEENKVSFGVEVNANHLKAMRAGFVKGVTTPIRIGRNLQVWDIKISNEDGELVCVSRLTVAIRDA